MPGGRVSGSFNSPTVDIVIETGNPFLNKTIDGFVKIGLISAAHTAAQHCFNMLKKQSLTKHDIETTIKSTGKEALHWGAIAGIYSGMEYGMERVRGKHDWKNALLGGAATGALVSIGDRSSDKIIQNAITGAAIATAAAFLNQ